MLILLFKRAEQNDNQIVYNIKGFKRILRVIIEWIYR